MFEFGIEINQLYKVLNYIQRCPKALSTQRKKIADPQEQNMEWLWTNETFNFKQSTKITV